MNDLDCIATTKLAHSLSIQLPAPYRTESLDEAGEE